jgi:type II secretory ATPase GspE/PulE/Tfp pilus assembly ATPase PilB-like protein
MHMSTDEPKAVPDAPIYLKDAPITDLVSPMVREAALRGTSDIHIEAMPGEILVRFRIDGVLVTFEHLSKDDHEHVINRLKVLSNMEMGRVRLPEDGHFAVKFQAEEDQPERTIDVRVSIFPTVNGPTAVLRLLNRSDMLISLDEIGFDEDIRFRVRQLTLASYGMILTTGPTGSGKTTTLYSMLMEINRKERNIMTVEDPVEVFIDDMRQSQIIPEIGFTFAMGMKSILRQDPDVIMIGEIRDAETAEHAVQASLTGRMVYSTLHANTTIGAIARLIDLNIERGMIAYAVRGVIAQRLVRKICPSCIMPDSQPRAEYINFLGLQGISIDYRRGAGCTECNGTGYRGRTGVFEVLIFDDELRAMIVDKASMRELQSYAEKAGMTTLRQNAINLVTSGVTTLEEAIRVV